MVISQTLPTTRYARPSVEEVLRLYIDGGNEDYKAMLHRRFGEEIHFPHSMRRPSMVEYKSIIADYKNSSGGFENTAIFQMDGQGFVVGAHAAQGVGAVKASGVERYTRNYIGASTVAALLMLHPQSHNNVEIIVTYPIGTETEQLKLLWQALVGTFVAELPNGNKVTYKVGKSSVISIPEPVASFNNFLLTQAGKQSEKLTMKIEPGMQFMLVDIGGWISAFVPGVVTPKMRLQPNTSAARRIMCGTRHVLSAFERELKQAFPKLNKVTGSLPRDYLMKALIEEQIVIGNSKHDCSTMGKNAMGVLTTAMTEDWVNTYSMGLGMSAAVLGGGGSTATGDFLIENMFADITTHYADRNLNRLRFGGVRGAVKGRVLVLGEG